MTLAAGARLGPYEIATLIGSGGMGEVYRARDPRLGRDVAIKVLPSAFSADLDRLRRFEQEARAAASLNHPSILAVFDIGTDSGAPFIVSELLDGETFRERLSRGPLAARKAIDLATQVAHGLAAAHDKGIVHRDLKPENLYATSDGRVKILDFGLAKLTEGGGVPALAGSLTTATVGTQPGVLLGTMGYMAPEQVRGHAADHRADVFAFGAVLYEMLTGRRAFHGATPADTITAILEKDPSAEPLNEHHVAPALQRVIDRCLEKNPAARFQSMHDLAFALEGVSGVESDRAHVPSATRSRRSGRELAAWAVAGILAAALAAVALQSRRASTSDAPSTRFSIAAPDGATLNFGTAATGALSPDGRHLVFAATRASGGPQMLWLRSLDSLDARMLPGTEHEGRSGAFWSPDSRFVAFFNETKLQKVDIGGGAPQTVCEISQANNGGSWSRGGVILFATAGGLQRVSASGGQPQRATTLDVTRGEINHRRPEFLPDGRRFTYVALPGNRVFVGSIDSPDVTPLLNADSQVVYAVGHLLFVRQGTLFAQPFDVSSLKLTGEAVVVANQVSTNSGAAVANFSVSAGGTLVFQQGPIGAAAPSLLTWIDRDGKVQGSIGTVLDYRGIEMSPDERRLAEHPHEVVGGGDLWVRDLSRETRTRLTFSAHATSPIWSPDGARLAFASNHPLSGETLPDPYAGTFNLYEKRADGTGDVTLLMDSMARQIAPGWKQPTSWSRDGQTIVFEVRDPKTSWDLWALPLNGDRKPRVILRTEFQELQGQLSPDGRWLAYASNETGQLEVYVRSFSGPSGKWQISGTGGSYPRWRSDGKELFYIARDRKLMAVAVNESAAAFEAGIPQAMFDVRVATFFISGNGFGGSANTPYPYVVSRDGQRFLMSVDTTLQQVPSPHTVVLNWPAGLRK